MNRLRGAFLLCLGFTAFSANAQLSPETSNDSASYADDGKLKVLIIPVVAGNPTVGVLFGVLPGLNWNFGDPATTKGSAALGGFYYTTNNQLFTSVRGTAFTAENEWNLMLDLRFNLNSQPTYGLGTRPVLSDKTLVGQEDTVSDQLFNGVPVQEMMGFNNFRFYQTALRRVRDLDFYLGLGYHLDIVWAIDDRNLDLANGDTTFHWEYQNAIGLSQEKYTQSGFSLNALWDSRDNIVNPYSGSYAFASWRLMPEFLGSTSNATQLWLEYRNYFNLSKKRPRNLLAFWAYGWFVTSGTSSYMFLPAVGWDMFARSARPYTQGRFRGQDLLYSELEWRFPLQRTSDRWGGVVFLNATTASSRLDQVPLFDYVKLGYGAGLRFMIDKKKRVNLGLDYGRGFNGASGFFLNLNEYF
jgi:hypothetical protein